MYQSLIGNKYTLDSAKVLIKEAEEKGFSLSFSDDLVLEEVKDIVIIDAYEDRTDNTMYGVYSFDQELIEEGFETEEDAETWASENGYELT